jgi:hypothetical protein
MVCDTLMVLRQVFAIARNTPLNAEIQPFRITIFSFNYHGESPGGLGAAAPAEWLFQGIGSKDVRG